MCFYRGLEFFNNLFKHSNKEKKMPKGKGTYGKKKGRPSKKRKNKKRKMK